MVQTRAASVLAATAALLAMVAVGCSDAPQDGRDGRDGALTGTTAVDPPDLRGAGRIPSPSVSVPTSRETAPGATPSVSGGFDCAAVDQARADLDAAVQQALDRLGLSGNSPDTFGVVRVTTAQHSHEYWQQALTQVPPDLDEAAGRVREHWRRADAVLDRIVLTTPGPGSVDAAVRNLERLLGGAATGIAPDEREIQQRLDAACGGTQP